MKIDAVDFFYLSMPEVTTEADGSQDALLVRVSAGAFVGWGECEASPLTSISAFICPMSHGVCRPVSASVLGQRIDEIGDISRIAALVERQSMDLLQAPHTWSGIEMALWDLLGKARDEPVWRLLGYSRTAKKIAYASLLFGKDPQETLVRARQVRPEGYAALKMGWGPIGLGSIRDDADHFHAAREGLGSDRHLLVDAGQVWLADVDAAAARLPALESAQVLWLEEPFSANALKAYSALAKRSNKVRLAGGEGSHNALMAQNLIDFGGVGFIQVDCGRIGGLEPAKRLADYAASSNVTYVNHTFTSHLALSASLQPFAGLAEHRLCEYPTAPKSLAWDITTNHLQCDANGEIEIPCAPGLGMTVNTEALSKYLVDVEIRVDGKAIFRTPNIL